VESTQATRDRVRVWDPFVRLFHWSLVGSFLVAYLSTSHIGLVHKGFGYATLALVAARVIWGFVGSGHARFSSFVPSPYRLGRYLAALAHGREPRHLGHNPAGAMMIVFMLGIVTAIGVSGWMLTTDAFWGNGAVEIAHTVLVDVALIAILLHVGGNIYMSIRHRENLAIAMVTGYKRTQPTEARPRPREDLRHDQPDAGLAD
jgi:cytochrome b